MIYRKFFPSPHLQALVECYYVWESAKALQQPVQIETPPTGFTAMVFLYGDPYQVSNENRGLEWVSPSFVTGQLTSHYQLHLTGKIGMFGVVFKPTALATIFGWEMPQLLNRRISLTDLFGSQGRLLTERMQEAQDVTERIKRVEQFLLDQLMVKSFKVNYADYAADIIAERRGNVSVKDLADELGISRRLLEKQFIAKVGLSPKYFARLKRIGHVCAMLISRKAVDWQDVILLGGYYDQSHFIKDFVEFIKQNPSQYYKTNQELVNFLTK